MQRKNYFYYLFLGLKWNEAIEERNLVNENNFHSKVKDGLASPNLWIYDADDNDNKEITWKSRDLDSATRDSVIVGKCERWKNQIIFILRFAHEMWLRIYEDVIVFCKRRMQHAKLRFINLQNPIFKRQTSITHPEQSSFFSFSSTSCPI